MNTKDLIAVINAHKQEYISDLEDMNYKDPSLYDYAEGVLDTCDFILSKLEEK